MREFPVLPRYELNARLPERGTDLILKDEWRLNRRSHQHPYPAPLPPYLCLASLPPAYTYICEKAPDSSPILNCAPKLGRIK